MTASMHTAEQIITPELTGLLARFNDLGGVIDFKIFKVSGASSNLTSELKNIFFVGKPSTFLKTVQSLLSYYLLLSAESKYRDLISQPIAH